MVAYDGEDDAYDDLYVPDSDLDLDVDQVAGDDLELMETRPQRRTVDVYLRSPKKRSELLPLPPPPPWRPKRGHDDRDAAVGDAAAAADFWLRPSRQVRSRSQDVARRKASSSAADAGWWFRPGLRKRAEEDEDESKAAKAERLRKQQAAMEFYFRPPTRRRTKTTTRFKRDASPSIMGRSRFGVLAIKGKRREPPKEQQRGCPQEMTWSRMTNRSTTPQSDFEYLVLKL